MAITNSIKAANPDNLFFEDFPELYSYLYNIQNDIVTNSLNTDLYYAELFSVVFNLDEPWYEDNYLTLVNNIINSLDPSVYVNTITILNIYIRLSNVENIFLNLDSWVSILNQLITNLSNPQNLDVSSIFLDIQNNINIKSTVDYDIFKLVSNKSKIDSLNINNYLPIIYYLDALYTPSDPNYYLTLVQNLNEYGILFSSSFLSGYIYPILNGIISDIENIASNLDSSLNTLSTGFSYFGNLYLTIINNLLLKYNSYRQIVLSTRELFISLNISNTLTQSLSNILVLLEGSFNFINTYLLSINLIGVQSTSTIDLTKSSNAINSINSTLFSNKSPGEVQNVIDQINNSTNSSNAGINVAIANTTMSVVNSLTPEMLNSSLSTQLNNSMTAYTNVSSGQINIVSSTKATMVSLSNQIDSTIDSINSEIRSIFSSGALGDILNTVNQDIEYINKLTNTVFTLNIFKGVLNTAICDIAQVLCTINLFINSISSLTSQLINLGTSLGTQAQTLYNNITGSITSVSNSMMLLEMDGVANSGIMSQSDAITAQVTVLLGSDKGAIFRSCFSSSAGAINGTISGSSSLSSQLEANVTSVETSLIAQFVGLTTGSKCSSGFNLNGITLPNPIFNKLNFKLPTFAINPPNCL